VGSRALYHGTLRWLLIRELEDLEWSDVRFDLGLLMIQEKTLWRPKTDERVIPISIALPEVLMEQHRKRKSDRWVIASRTGGREAHLLEKVNSICRRAGIAPRAATVHALRHRAALSHLGPLLPAERVSPVCVTPPLEEGKRLSKSSKQMSCGRQLGIGGEGGIRTLGPGLPRTTA
jgi:hypothetical protein